MLVLPTVAKFADEYFVSDESRAKWRRRIRLVRQVGRVVDDTSDDTHDDTPYVRLIATCLLLGGMAWVVYFVGVAWFDDVSAGWLGVRTRSLGFRLKALAVAHVHTNLTVLAVGLAAMSFIAGALVIVSLAMRLAAPATREKVSPLVYAGSLLSVTLGLVKAALEVSRR